MNTGKLVNLLFAVALIAVAVVAAVFLYRDYQHYDKLERERQILEKRLASLERESEKREGQIEKLQGDSEYIESVIRSKLKYAKEDETIFRFEE